MKVHVWKNATVFKADVYETYTVNGTIPIEFSKKGNTLALKVPKGMKFIKNPYYFTVDMR